MHGYFLRLRLKCMEVAKIAKFVNVTIGLFLIDPQVGVVLSAAVAIVLSGLFFLLQCVYTRFILNRNRTGAT